MKIAYVVNMRLPTERAHGAQVFKACEALVRAGERLELIVTNRRTHISADPFAYYGVSKRFPVIRLPTLDTVSWGMPGFILESVLFGISVAAHIRKTRPDVVYGRDEIVLWVLSLLTSVPFVWESHDGAWNFWARRVTRRSRGLVVVSHGAESAYVERGVPNDRILVVPNGIEFEHFASAGSKQAARERLSLPHDATVALYIGALGGWKGTRSLLEASALLPDVLVGIIGGSSVEQESLRREYPGVRFLGSTPYSDLPDVQAAANVLVVPNTAAHEISLKFTSPLKLIAHLASGIPVVVSDLPSTRELVDDSLVTFCTPDDPHALAQAIIRALGSEAKAKALRAKEYARRFDWSERAQRVLQFISTRVQ